MDSLNSDIYTMVRGVNIPTVQIDMVEQEYGVKLVPDKDWKILRALDLTLQKYRLGHENREPDVVMLSDYPDKIFKHMVLNINFMGMTIPGAYNKPSWFWLRKNF